MTGRELILYILANGLEDEPVFEDGTFIGFETEGRFAERCNVGVATVHAWAETGVIEFVRIGESIYIPVNTVFHIAKKELDNNE